MSQKCKRYVNDQSNTEADLATIRCTQQLDTIASNRVEIDLLSQYAQGSCMKKSVRTNI